MSPRFALAVDPVCQHVIDLLDRIERGEHPAPENEQLTIRRLLERGEALLGSGAEWNLARYALVSWIDELLVETPWNGQQWWSNNILEMELYRTRLCSEAFFERAREASVLPQRDALEVFYNCVLLGFRGQYGAVAASEIQPENSTTVPFGHPATLEAWLRQTEVALRLANDRPTLAAPTTSISGAPPLTGHRTLAWSLLLAVGIGLLNVIGYRVWFAT